MAYPAVLDSFTATAGTTLVATDDHSDRHNAIQSALVNVETTLGTNSGTSVIKNFTAGDFAVRMNAGGTLKQALVGTLTGTACVFVNPSLTGGTAQSLTLGTFTAGGVYPNGTLAGSLNINWANGDRQKLAVGETDGTLYYSNAAIGQILNMSVDYLATGGGSVTLPTSVFPGTTVQTFGTANDSLNEMVVKYDGTNYRTQIAASFA